MSHQFKIVLAGDASSGKSSIVLRITEAVFENLPPTIGCDFKKHTVKSSSGQQVNLIIWDTAGEEKYQSIMSSYYRGAHGVILVYDVSSRKSFQNIERLWLEQIELYCNRGADHVVVMLLGHKIDLCGDVNTRGARAVSLEEGMSLAQSKGMIFAECSSKWNQGLTEAMQTLADRLLAVYQDGPSNASTGTVRLTDNVDASSSDQGGYCGC